MNCIRTSLYCLSCAEFEYFDKRTLIVRHLFKLERILNINELIFFFFWCLFPLLVPNTIFFSIFFFTFIQTGIIYSLMNTFVSLSVTQPITSRWLLAWTHLDALGQRDEGVSGCQVVTRGLLVHCERKIKNKK